jgi:hypothetical protein
LIGLQRYDYIQFVQKCTIYCHFQEYQTMQISRHWRLNSQRYRLQGVRYENGAVSLQSRPSPLNAHEERAEVHQTKDEKTTLKAAS